MFFKQFDLQQFTSAFIVLFAVIDAIGAIPLFIRLESKGKKIDSKKAAILCAVMFLCFFYIGEAFLNLFHLDISSFAVAGSFVIAALATEMILNIEIFRDSPDIPNDATFMPVVFPTLAGAGTLTTLLSIRAEYADINILLALIVNIILIYFVLRSAKRIEKFLGKSVIFMVQKMFGVILLAIALKIFITNVTLLIEKI